MDALKLRQIFEKLDQALEHPTELLIRGGAAVLAHGLEQRATIGIDVLPASRFVEADLRRACAVADLGFNPSDKDFVERDYLEVVPEETLILPRPDPERGANTVFRGLRLTVRTPPAADLVIGKLKRLDPEDLTDVTFLIRHFRLTAGDLEEAFDRLPARFKADPVVQDNKGGVAPADLALLRQMVPLALSLLGALPDGSDGDPASLLLLARRQARALELGRRRHLVRLAARLGLEMSRPPYDPVPRRLQRPYELIGWVPPRPSTDHETASQKQVKRGLDAG